MKRVKKNLFINWTLLLVIISAFLIFAPNSLAAENKLKSYLNTAREQSGYEQPGDVNSLPPAVTNAIAYILSLVGIIFFILIVVSGFQWMTAGGNEDKIAEAKKRMINATIGLGLTLAAFIITFTIFKFFFQETQQSPYGGVEPPPGNQNIIACASSADCAGHSPRLICDTSVGNCVECLSDSDCPANERFCHPQWKTCMVPEGTSCEQINDSGLCLSNGCKWIVSGYGDGGTWASGQCAETTHPCPQCAENTPVCVQYDTNPPTYGCVECLTNVAPGDCSSLQSCTPGHICFP